MFIMAEAWFGISKITVSMFTYQTKSTKYGYVVQFLIKMILITLYSLMSLTAGLFRRFWNSEILRRDIYSSYPQYVCSFGLSVSIKIPFMKENDIIISVWMNIQTRIFAYIICTPCTASKPYVYTVYPKKYAHGFVVLCFVVVMQSFIINSHEVFIHIHQGCFAGTGAIVRLPQCQWSKPDGYGIISQCITTTKHSKSKTVGIFLGIYCIYRHTICTQNLCRLWIFYALLICFVIVV